MMKRDVKQQARFERLASKLGLSVEQTDELCDAADATWNYIAYDCFQCGGDQEMSRAEVIEVVLDADHIVSNNHRLSKEVVAVLRGWDAEKSKMIHTLLKECVFVYALYGM